MLKQNSLIQELRELLPEYMAHKQILIGKKNKRPIHCINPAHPDKNPSMSYHRESCTLHCFSCGVSYDLFDVIALDYPECNTFPAQLKKACEIFGKPFPENLRSKEKLKTARPITAKTIPIPPAVESRLEYTAMIEEEIGKYNSGGTYFAARGLSQETCEKYRLYQTPERAILPIFTQGACYCYCARALDDRTQPRYKNSAGAMDIFGVDCLLEEGKSGELFITESIFDALSVHECGYRAIALCGTANVQKLIRLCRDHPTIANSYTFIAAGDADEAGARMNRQISEGLSALGLSCRELLLPPGVKDLNELLIKDRKALAELLDISAHADRLSYQKTSSAWAVGELLDLSIRRGSREGVSTGFAALDRVLDGGLYAGLYVIGAVSSVGKTSFVLQIADAISKNGGDVLYFSLEMSRVELMAKSISRLSWEMDSSEGHARAFTSRQVLKFDFNMPAARGVLFSRAVEAYREEAGGMYIREGIADIGVGQIREAVREHIRMRGGQPIVIVDYLQILCPPDMRATDKQNTDRNVTELKRISRDFDIPVVAVSSFNRENYRNAVSMEAFKESGAVEYSSDVLLGMQLAGAGESGFDLNAAKQRHPREMELVMLKNRSGVPYAKIAYAYHAKYNSFFEIRQGKYI